MGKTSQTTGKKPIAAAIDGGYGLFKHAIADENGELTYGHFHSMAVPSDPATMRSLSVRQRDTIDVVVGDASYEVGRDILLAQTGNDVGREIGDNWVMSDMYRALMLGALHYMNTPVIDTLVLGLPVNQYLNESRCNGLISEYAGKSHKVGGGKTVEVKHVIVRPQPFGGYLDMGDQIDLINNSIKKLADSNKDSELAIAKISDANQIVTDLCVLIVDPGEHTLDWLFVDKGSINTKASSVASDSGRHRIVRDVQRTIEQELGRSVAPSNLTRINEALRTGEKLKLGGQLVDMSKYDTVVAQSVADPISRLIEGLRGLEDRIDLIYLVGGHPEIYERELQKRFPYTPVVVSENSLYANVRGFLTMGEEMLANKQAA